MTTDRISSVTLNFLSMKSDPILVWTQLQSPLKNGVITLHCRNPKSHRFPAVKNVEILGEKGQLGSKTLRRNRPETAHGRNELWKSTRHRVNTYDDIIEQQNGGEKSTYPEFIPFLQLLHTDNRSKMYFVLSYTFPLLMSQPESN